MTIRQRVSRTLALLKYHRPQQFAWRLIRMGQRKTRPLLPNAWSFQSGHRSTFWKAGAADAFQTIATHRLRLWPNRHAKPKDIDAGKFCFLNHSCDLSRSQSSGDKSIDWNPDQPRLWRFHLQCHEYLPECASEVDPDLAYGLLKTWLDAPRHQYPTADPDAWHPFCISRRIPAWLTLAAAFPPPDSIHDRFWSSLADQVAWLSQNCEWDLGGNHLLENLSTLFLADCFLESQPGLRLATVGETLAKEYQQQLLNSGEHMERAPTYHALMTVCVLQSVCGARFANSPQQSSLASSAGRMTAFLRWITSPGASLPLLGDSCVSETPDVPDLLQWADDSDISSSSIVVEEDYWKSQPGDTNQLLFDIGELACDHLPAHGHADLLNVTADIAGSQAIVDTGVFQYAPGPLRDQSRCTAAHNVLQIDGREQCDLWSSFRMGRRGHILWKTNGETDGVRWCAAAHDGYGNAVGRLLLASNDAWAIIDWFDPNSVDEQVVSRLHWHPDWNLHVSNDCRSITACHQTNESSLQLITLGNGSKLLLEASHYWPDFGVELQNQVVQNVSSDCHNGWLGIQVNLHHDATPLAESIRSVDGFLQLTNRFGTPLTFDASQGLQN